MPGKTITARCQVLVSVGIAIALLAGCHRNAKPTGRAGARPSSPQDSIDVGYGSQARRDVTGAISSTSGDDVMRSKPTSVADILVGRFPGVEVQRLAGGGVSVRIRGQRSLIGSSEPLYVIDGITTTSAGGGVLADLDPRDIKSIDVLKDASATSVYGSRGANGVIIITTKRAR